MSRTLSTSERALNAEFERVGRAYPGKKVKTAIESSTVRKVIRDILSISPDAELPGTEEEHALLEQVICLMSFHNRKWLSQIQVAIPHGRLTSGTDPKDTKLKSKVPVSLVTREGTQQPALSDIELRNYFLRLLYLCIPKGEQNTFPHLLSLYNSNEDESETADQLEVVVESGAWLVLSNCQRLVYAAERQARPQKPPAQRKNIREISIEEIRSIQDGIIASTTKKISESNWRLGLINTPPSLDGLFAKLLINAALNRFILENWAFDRRTRSVAEIHQGFLSELEQTVPDGLSDTLGHYRVNGKICHRNLAKHVLKHSISKHKNALTENVLKALDAQTEAVLASANLKEYAAEREVNQIFQRSPEISSAMTWLSLAWIYLNDKSLPDDSPDLHTGAFRPVSRRARATEIGQNMVSLRRVLSSLLLNHHYDLPSAERSGLHARWVMNVRGILIRALVHNFKGASLSQWDSVLSSDRTAEELASQLKICGLPPRPIRIEN